MYVTGGEMRWYELPWFHYLCHKSFDSTSHQKSRRTLKKPNRTWTCEDISNWYNGLWISTYNK